MAWRDVKGYVGRENNTFKTNDVKDLIIKGFIVEHLKYMQTIHSLYVHRG
jgi:hypothetical protein